MIGRPGTPPPPEDLAALLLFDIEELQYLASLGKNDEAQNYMDLVRSQWRLGFENLRSEKAQTT